MIGRPLGDDAFLDAISRRLNRVVTPRKRGRKAHQDGTALWLSSPSMVTMVAG